MKGTCIYIFSDGIESFPFAARVVIYDEAPDWQMRPVQEDKTS